MKIGKLHKVSGTLKVLLGLAAAGALLFASCQNIFDAAAPKTQNDGYGYVVVNLGDAARTVRPDPADDLSSSSASGSLGTNNTKFSYITYKFVGLDSSGKELDITETWNTSNPPTGTFSLPEGTYKLIVNAYSTIAATGGKALAATGEYNDKGTKTFQVVGGDVITVYVALTAREVPAETGALTVNVTIPANSGTPVTSGYVFELKQYLGDDEAAPLVPVENVSFTRSTNLVTINGTGSSATTNYKVLSPGTYQLSGRINASDANGAYFAGFSEAVHIVSNMTTDYTRTYAITPGANQIGMAQVKDSSEAIKILQEEIASWVTPPTGNNRSILAYGDPEIDTTNNTITLNYIGTELATSAFPLTLQGGWEIIPSSPSNTGLTTFSVTDTVNPFTFYLRNHNVNVDTTNALYVFNTTYTLIINPVAEFQVWYADGVDKTGNRGVTIKVATKDVSLTGAQTAKDPGIGISGLGAAAITATNAAITDGGVYAPLDNTNVYNIPGGAVSAVYKIVIYETAKDQADKALEKMKAEIINKDKVSSITPWITQSGAFAKVDPQGDLTTAQLTGLPGNPTAGIVLYYVFSRLNNNMTLTIDLPNDRWNRETPVWTISHTANLTTPTTDNMYLGFTPIGGTKVIFAVRLIPVAEFYVDFGPKTDPGTPGTPGYRPDYVDDTDPEIKSINGKIGITDGDSANQIVDFAETNISGKRFALGARATTIKLTNVAIMIDDNGSTFRNAYKLVGTPADTSPVPPAAAGSVKNDAIVQEGDYTVNSPALKTGTGSDPNVNTLIGAISREYHIKVYPSLKYQEDAARAKISGLVQTSAIAKDWLNPVPRRVEALSHVTPPPSTGLPVSNIVYVDATEPTVTLPGGTPGTSNTRYPQDADGYGWYMVDDQLFSTPVGSALPAPANFVKDTKLQFKSFGGEVNPIYIFRVYAAAEYSISFERAPMGNSKADGTVTVAGTSPWLTTQPPNPTHRAADGDVSDQLIGLGATKLTFSQSAGSIVFGYSAGYDSTLTGATQQISGIAYGSTVAVDTLASQTYVIKVYPGVGAQKTNVTEGLAAITNLNGWITGSTTVKAGRVTTPTPTNPTSEFQVVTPPTFVLNNSTLSVPPGFLNSDYAAQLNVGAIASSAPDAPTSLGTRNDTITFVPLGKGSSDTDLIYKFNLIQVVRYNVNFKDGPDATKPKLGTIKIITNEPGKSTPPTAGFYTIAQSDSPNYIIGAIGGTATITSPEGNVFSDGTSTINGADSATPGTSDTIKIPATGTQTASATFDIDVYPRVDEQVNQVLSLLRTTTGPITSTVNNADDGWFTVGPYGSGIPDSQKTTLRGPIVPQKNAQGNFTNISNMQYILGRAAGSTQASPIYTDLPKVLVPSKFLSTPYQGATNANGLKAGNSGTPSGDGSAAGTVTLSFLPKGLTTGATNYTFNMIPIARYTVKYTNAEGTVKITPTTTPTDESEIIANPTTNKVGYGGLGATSITITGQPGSFTRVQIIAADGIATTLTPASGSGTVSTPAGWTASTSGDYTIEVLK